MTASFHVVEHACEKCRKTIACKVPAQYCYEYWEPCPHWGVVVSLKLAAKPVQVAPTRSELMWD